MRKIFSFIILAMSMLFVFSCKDENKKPIITFDDVGKGAYPRRLSVTNDVFDIRDAGRLGNSSYQYSVEFVDLEKGKLVTEYNVYAAFDDNNPANGDDGKAEKLYKTFTSGNFKTSEAGFVAIDMNIPSADLLSLFGLTIDKLKPEDKFDIRTELKLESGSVHSSANSTASVNGAAFKAYFDANVFLTCPLTTEFTGTYKLTYDAPSTGALGAIFGDDPGTVDLAAGSDRGKTQRSFTIKHLPGTSKEKSVTVTLDFLCGDRIEMGDVAGADGCISGETLTIGQGALTNFDLGNDASFKINFVDLKKDGGCGYDAAPVTITFTKQ